MFGEDYIIGQSDGKIDAKNRLFVPKFTNVEFGDKLVAKVENQNLLLYSYCYYVYPKLEKLNKLKNEAKSYEEILKYEELINELCKTFSNWIIADKQTRVIIPKKTISSLNWQPAEDIEFIGQGDSLLIRKK